MNPPEAKLSQKEEENYARHGIAHLRISEMTPVPISGCSVNLEKILQIGAPKACWLRQIPIAPELIIVSDKARNIPTRATVFDPNKTPKSVEVRYWHNDDKDYDHPEITVVY